ncbi:MAG: hypothetical protein CR967_02995 [Proteobacteria bacterium]|nr:MAG: hypothetical protein CR967_02995 [Pseudomonadota bacterium]
MKKIVLALSVLVFIGCGGGGGSSDGDEIVNLTNTKPETINSELETKIANELKNASSYQKIFVKKHPYGGYIKTTQGFRVKIGEEIVSCDGINYAGAYIMNNKINLISIDNDNDTLEGYIPKVGNKYVLNIDDGETTGKVELNLSDDKKYLTGYISLYEKEVKKYCKREIYLKKQ